MDEVLCRCSDHPFAAVSDENGDLTIKGLPAGEELVFRVYHGWWHQGS